jgi:amino acid transporter
MAPSTSPSLTIPLVFALAGNGTWFVYLLATIATFLVGFCVSRFARLSASPGSLYTYAADTLPRGFGVVAAWGLLLAYVATGASVAGGGLYYINVLWQQFLPWLHFTPPPLLTLAVLCGVAAFVAYRDVKLSAEMMLWIEVVSVSLILIVLAVLVFHFGFQFDLDQFRLKGVSIASLGPGPRARYVHLRRLRKRNHAGRRSARAHEDHSPRRPAIRHPRWRLLHGLLVL